MLRFMASLSRLFSENSIPYLDYRLTENLFCKYYGAVNDARACTAYDARIGGLGIGIKTFGIPNDSSVEKIAEFNRLKPQLDHLKGLDLAIKLAEFRNDRIDFANSTYNVTDSLYHIIGRKNGRLVAFNSPYTKIDIASINDVKENTTSISFNDGKDFYTFNKSKSVLQKRFELPQKHVDIPVDILADPLETLYNMLKEDSIIQGIPYISPAPPITEIEYITTLPIFRPRVKGYDYVILPLYSTRGKTPTVPLKSGLNQWNAEGRKRDADEIYIAIPKIIHKRFPDFFPHRDLPFELQLPDGKALSAKVCQDGSKALMSNPNSELGNWILRKVLKMPVGKVVTMDDLIRYGIDSVLIEDLHTTNSIGQRQYKISFTNSDYESFSEFINE